MADVNKPDLQFSWLKAGEYHAGEEIKFEPITITSDHPDYDKYAAFIKEQGS